METQTHAATGAHDPQPAGATRATFYSPNHRDVPGVVLTIVEMRLRPGRAS